MCDPCVIYRLKLNFIHSNINSAEILCGEPLPSVLHGVVLLEFRIVQEMKLPRCYSVAHPIVLHIVLGFPS